VHPHLRGLTSLCFSHPDNVERCDVLFLCMPHGKAMNSIEKYKALACKIIDLSADFRLNNDDDYKKWYGVSHVSPKLLSSFVYGIPELHRQNMVHAPYVSSAGCNATATILALRPLIKANIIDIKNIVVEVKVGSSEGGASSNDGSHHPLRTGSVRSYKPIKHRHIAEIQQELGLTSPVHFSATAIQMVRGLLATCHVFVNENITERDIWKIYRRAYDKEPFVRIIKDKDAVIRCPDPKILTGTNYCDIGFYLDDETNRLVVLSAIDNLMKGASGQAVQCFNVMHGFEEKLALDFPGVFPA